MDTDIFFKLLTMDIDSKIMDGWNAELFCLEWGLSCVCSCVPMCIHSHVCIFTPYAGAHLCVSMCVHTHAVCRHPPRYSQLPAFFFLYADLGNWTQVPMVSKASVFPKGLVSLSLLAPFTQPPIPLFSHAEPTVRLNSFNGAVRSYSQAPHLASTTLP